LAYEFFREAGVPAPRTAYAWKRFINKRAESVRRQLDGKSRGMILKYPKER
jgi:hypothetical protein